jgi:hypothetical protein
MTFLEMRHEAELLYESINSSAAPGFTDEEWGIILTRSQHSVVEEILKKGVVRDASTELAIEILFKTNSYSSFENDDYFKNADGSAAKRSTAILNDKFIWILDEYADTASLNNIRLRRITFDFYRINLDNPFRHPHPETGFWIVQKDNIPVFITDGTAITSYNVLGVEHPDNYPIDSTHDCILNKGVQCAIIEAAVKLARMSVIDTAGYQLAMAEFNKQ